MLISTVIFLSAMGFTVHGQQFEPFNENSISLDGFFEEEFDSINHVPDPTPQTAEETTVASPPLVTVPPVQSINVFEGEAEKEKAPVQSGLVFDEVEFPPEVASREEAREESVEGGREGSEEGKRGISIYRPVEQGNTEKKKKSGSTGWSHKRKRLVKKGTKIIRTNWTVVPSNISTLRPHFQRKRRILTRVSHVKPVRPPTVHMPTHSGLGPAPLPRISKTQWIDSRSHGRKKTKGISRSRSRDDEGRGHRMLSNSDRSLLSRVARTDERQERKMREEQSTKLKMMKDQLTKIDEQIQVQSARRRFEFALDRNPPQNPSPPLSSLHLPLASSSFSHYSPPPLLLPPLRTTQLSSLPRHHLNAHAAPVLLHRLHDGDWQRLRLLQRVEKQRSEGRRRRRRV